MALFRFYSGSLHDSLQTTIIVKDIHELLERILTNYLDILEHSNREILYQWQIFIDSEEVFDPRIGWYTHKVYFQVRNSDPFLAGFLSEPLETDRLQVFHKESVNAA